MTTESGTIVITGATGGIGRLIAQKAMAAGYAVTGLARSADPAAAFSLIACDVSDAAQVHAAFASLREKPIWALINAAGAAAMNLHVTTPAETMRKVIGCNLLGTMYCCAEAGRIMVRRRRGRIINFSTIAVALGLAGESSYVAAKAGIEGFSRSFAREMAPFGITVNAVAPGPVATRLISGVPKEKIEALRSRQIVTREVTAADVWDVVAWLLSEESATISGETLHVGGV